MRQHFFFSFKILTEDLSDMSQQAGAEVEGLGDNQTGTERRQARVKSSCA